MGTAAKVDYLAINAYIVGTVTPVDCFQGPAVSTDCSTFCGTGTQTWTRPTLQAPLNGGAACDVDTWSATCNDFTRCPQACTLSDWSDYSECDSPCGPGNETRTRRVLSPPINGGTPCGPLRDVRSCENAPCSGSACLWGPWIPVGYCSVPGCGGTQKYVRNIAWRGSSGDCTGPSEKLEPCNQQLCSGSLVPLTLQATLVQTTTDDSETTPMYHQVWDTTPAEVTPGVHLVLSGRATDQDSGLQPADGWWQIVTEQGAPNCWVISVGLTCPGSDANVEKSIIGGILGKIQCHDTVGQLDSLATAVFTVVC